MASSYTCLFAHFNSNERICEYVHTYLDHLSSLDFRIIFLSNSPINSSSRVRLEKNPGIYRIEERENTGNDFGAWKWAIENNLIPDDTNYLLLIYDSNLGPISDLTPIFQSMLSNTGLDFWGLTDSYQGAWHIQSYFVCFSKKAFTSVAFQSIFSQDFYGFPKKEIVQKGEILLTQKLTANGLKGQAYIPYSELDSNTSSLHALNPTHFYWDKLITDHKFPFVKKELILQNPENIPNINEIFPYIERNSDYSVENIKEALVDAFQSASDKTSNKPRITILCHMYYPSCIYYFMLKLAPLKLYDAHFIFNLSVALLENKYFMDILTSSFPGSIILHSPNKGRDIGGKLSAIDALLKSGTNSDYSLVIHDKLSPHTPTGKECRDKLFKIIEKSNLPKIFSLFEQNKGTGVVAVGDFIQNEYDPDNNSFTCTSKENLIGYIKLYGLTLSDYNFAAGTIFWIRTGILLQFFGQHSPLAIRKGLEDGNALDFTSGTNIHAWERLFSFLANAQGYKIKGI